MIKAPTFAAWVFTLFLIVYGLTRAYWYLRADRNPVQERKGSFLDRFNVLLVMFYSGVVPMVALATHWLASLDYPENAVLTTASIPFLLTGVALFWKAHRDLGENFSATLELKKNHTLVTNGIFSRVRHPMYLSIWLCVIGQALCVPNWLGGFGALVAWSFLYFIRINKEEQMMQEKFGEVYRVYMKKTGRIFPKFTRGQ